jgi:hypothetical protein
VRVARIKARRNIEWVFQKDLLLELRQKYVAVGPPVRTYFDLYFFNAKVLVYKRRTAAQRGASKTRIDNNG